jgi:two-component system LytT family response regulator
MKISYLIVDDEPMARKGLEEDLRDIDFMELKGVAENALQALELNAKHSPQLIFLDIEMPKLSGIDLIHSLKNPPMVIIVSAYPAYALESYNLDVVDYLLKPVAFSRLLKACNKAREISELKQNAAVASMPGKDYFFIKCESKYEKILLDELLFIEAADNYILVYTTAKRFITYLTLKSMEDYLPKDKFIKVHKSFIVAKDKINALDGNTILMNQHKIPIGRSLRDTVVAQVVQSKMIKR